MDREEFAKQKSMADKIVEQDQQIISLTAEVERLKAQWLKYQSQRLKLCNRIADQQEQLKRLVEACEATRTKPCDHPGCWNHRTHPCEGCGKIAGLYPSIVAALASIQPEQAKDGDCSRIYEVNEQEAEALVADIKKQHPDFVPAIAIRAEEQAKSCERCYWLDKKPGTRPCFGCNRPDFSNFSPKQP